MMQDIPKDITLSLYASWNYSENKKLLIAQGRWTVKRRLFLVKDLNVCRTYSLTGKRTAPRSCTKNKRRQTSIGTFTELNRNI